MTPNDFSFLKNKFVMVDLETLSTRSDAAIVSIGACKFTFADGVTDDFKINVDPKSSKEHGCHIEKDTIDWWSKQSKEARNSWKTDAVPLDVAMTSFVDWWGKDPNLWFACNGMSFDAPILNFSLKKVGLKAPWKYWNEMDLRTIYNIFGKKTSDFKQSDLTYHDALVDAKFQVKNMMQLFNYEAF